jgi:hypothetical protein
MAGGRGERLGSLDFLVKREKGSWEGPMERLSCLLFPSGISSEQAGKTGRVTQVKPRIMKPQGRQGKE